MMMSVIGALERYRKIIGLCWSTALAAEMEYRLNFLLAALTSLGGAVGSVFSLFLFYRTGYQFHGWSWHEALLVLSIFTILDGFAGTFLAPNLGQIVRHVQQGTLDFVLLRPISSQFWLSVRTLSPWGLPDLLVGVGLLAYTGTQLHLSWLNYLVGAIPLSFGLVSLYSLWFILGATSIWFVKIYNVTEVLRGLLEAGRFPMAAYPTAYRFFFTFVVPVAFLTSVPAEAMLGHPATPWIWGSGFLAGILFLVSHLFWRFALGFYTSASS